jgi:hypothetical protein
VRRVRTELVKAADVDCGHERRIQCRRTQIRELPVGQVRIRSGSRPSRAGQGREILGQLSNRLEQQWAAGSRFLIGAGLTALDIYWAAMATLIQPLPPELCPMAPGLRKAQTMTDPALLAAAKPLLEHRDFIYREYLKLPLDF